MVPINFIMLMTVRWSRCCNFMIILSFVLQRLNPKCNWVTPCFEKGCDEMFWDEMFCMFTSEITMYYDILEVHDSLCMAMWANYCSFLGCKPQYSRCVAYWVVPFISFLPLNIIGWLTPDVWPVELWPPTCSRWAWVGILLYIFSMQGLNVRF